MSSIQATRLRKGMLINHEGGLCRILEIHHITPGNKRGHVLTKMRDIRTGRLVDNKFRAEDDLDRATLIEHEMQYLYREGDLFHFMNTETYEQITLDSEALGDAVGYLLADTVISVEFYDGHPIGIEIPSVVELAVVETEPELKGATVSNVNKSAKLETGIQIQVPPFIKQGDRVRVNTTDGSYIERAK